MSSTKPLWTHYRITWDFPDHLCGSVPKDPALIKGWLDARKPQARPPDSRSIPEIQAEVLSTMLSQETDEEVEQRTWLGFQAHPTTRHLVMGARTIRGHVKDCARIVSSAYVGTEKGVRSFSVRFVNGFYPVEYWIPILRREDNAHVLVPDGYQDKAIHVYGPQGQRNALKRFDYVTNVRMAFTVRVLPWLKRSDLETLFEYGAVHGYAGERSEGEGRYIYTIEPVEVTAQEEGSL